MVVLKRRVLLGSRQLPVASQQVVLMTLLLRTVHSTL
jgi:hypothetical protein